MPHFERNGVRIHYEARGEGPAFLLSHGFGATLRMFDPQADVLARRHRLIAWDMRGHGETGSPEDPAAYSQEETVEDMAALLRHLGADGAILGGMSLGGTMSLAFCHRHPERVRALILIDSGPGFKSEPPRERWNDYAEGAAKAIEQGGVSALLQSTEVADSKHRSARGLALAARGMMKQRDARVYDSLPAIKVPTLILVGANDGAFLGAADLMERKIPGAVKQVIPDAGHAANMDQPQIVNDAVLAFLEKVDPA
jgi:pimeloyl-ACP methyl ester carboxylesterase